MTGYVAVVGPGAEPTPENLADARAVGALLGAEGLVVVTGGLGGVMGAAVEGAAAAGGTTVGLLPDPDRQRAHPALTVSIPTGLGELRNGLVVRAADCVVAVGGSWGTLSEVALAARTGVPVVSLGGWELPEGPVERVRSVAEAIAAVRRALASRPRSSR